MQDASVLATAHYPETLDRIFVSSPKPHMFNAPSDSCQIIGAPNFFPTVWGWIKRWFDPVTVSKIFILAKHEVKPTLEKFMEPKDIPKKYGGQLEWDWGQLPNLDDDTRAALEEDGKKGWIAGPALWLNSQRVTVGSENGKLRRPDSEIAKMKPVVYAADGTEVPVHAEATPAAMRNGSVKASNGAALAPPAPMQRLSSQHAATAAQAATSNAAATTAAATTAGAATAGAVALNRSNSKTEPPTTSDSTAAAASAMTADSKTEDFCQSRFNRRSRQRNDLRCKGCSPRNPRRKHPRSSHGRRTRQPPNSPTRLSRNNGRIPPHRRNVSTKNERLRRSTI